MLLEFASKQNKIAIKESIINLICYILPHFN